LNSPMDGHQGDEHPMSQSTITPSAVAAPTLPMLEKRRIEAAILKHVYETVKASHGEPAARQTVADAVRRSAIEQAQALAAEVGGRTSMQTFIDRQGAWRMGDALTIDVKEASDTKYVYRVTRCRYAEMYREMGLGDIGHLLSCQRDGTFCEGYDKNLTLKRTQTLMQGASHCDFDYTYEKDKG
jgi:L-2-amino-thiazoline-4-carboxylic acid hydrolase